MGNSREGRLGCLEGRHSRLLKGHCFGTLGRGAVLTETDFSIEVAGDEATKTEVIADDVALQQKVTHRPKNQSEVPSITAKQPRTCPEYSSLQAN